MNYQYFDLSKLKSYSLIQDVIIHPLKVNRDPRGILAETIKTTWKDVYNKEYPFTQSYFSITKPNIARDENQWHFHPTKQVDRFVIAQGKAVFSLYDWRKDSSTYGRLNLFLMGELGKDKGYYHLLIPKNVLHCFLVVSQRPALILNFPSAVYDPQEEGRISFNKVKINQKEHFAWNKIRKDFKISLKN